MAKKTIPLGKPHGDATLYIVLVYNRYLLHCVALAQQGCGKGCLGFGKGCLGFGKGCLGFGKGFYVLGKVLGFGKGLRFWERS